MDTSNCASLATRETALETGLGGGLLAEAIRVRRELVDEGGG